MTGRGAPAMWLVILTGDYFYDHVSSHGVFAAASPDVALALAGCWAGKRYRRDLVIQEAQVYELTERQRKSWQEARS